MRTWALTRDDSNGPITRGVRIAAIALCLGIGCYLAQQFSIALRFPPTRISTIWLPGGLLLTALLVVPPRRWWVYLPAAAAGIAAALAGDVPLAALVAFVFVVCGSFAAVAAVVRRGAGGPPCFDHSRHVTLFLVGAAFVLPPVAALGSAVLAVTSGWREGFRQVWLAQVLTAVVGIVTVTPVIVVAVTGGLARLRSAPARWWAEAVALGLGVLGVSAAAFGGSGSAPGLEAVWLLYVPLPLLVWATVRFGAGGASLALLGVVLVSTTNAVNGRGPFAAHSPADNVLSLQLSVLAMGMPLLFLAAVVAERRRTARALAASEEDARHQLAELATVYRTAPVGLAFVDTDLRFVKVNDHLAEIDGRSASDHVGRTLREILPAALATELEVIYREVIGKNRQALEQEIRGTTAARPGVERTWLASYFPVRDEQGKVLGVNTVVREVTAEKQAEELLRQSHEEVQDLAGRLIAAQEAERGRIARELHDDINQRLAALAIAMSGLKRRLAGEQAAATVDEVSRLQEHVVQITDAIRHLSHELHPGVLQHAGLTAALEAHCAEFRAGDAIDVTFEAGGDVGDVPPAAALCLYRVAQESLRNVARHANARSVRLTLTRAGDDLEIAVTDDGSGFDPGRARRGGGLGLISLDERVRVAGGSLQIHSRAGGGTELRVRIPIGGRAG